MTMRFSALFLGLILGAHADTLTLKNGLNVTGEWVGVDAGQIRFVVSGQMQTYPRSDVAKVTFAARVAAATSTAQPAPPAVAQPAVAQPAFKPIDAPAPVPESKSSSVSTGDTKEQVVAAWGQPQKTAKSGNKEIYFYKDAKVTFVDGVVSDVQ